MAISRLAASFFSAANENIATLANLNFDFTLIKYQVPQEFEIIGENLSLQRRKDAEEGPVHQTARRLGALFEQLVPPAPKLIRAYGLRASEIAGAPGVSPRGTRSDGPFEAFVGADGTSLWAAATSERSNAPAHAPLAMHLLACMLARAWEPDKAIAIWVEIVNERQKEIDVAMDIEPQMASACWAARQKISRKQLAAWDASARSWLRSADDARVSDRVKLMLILKNLMLPMNQGKSTYDNVIGAWRHAMIGMEKLVDGMPQQVSDGSILLALSAWHLFPDLIVLGESAKHVSFADHLIRRGGVITIGLHPASEEPGEGMKWSLALSHFRYYGDPIRVNSEPDTMRITMEQLHVVVFGSILSSWGISATKQRDAANWLIALRDFLAQPADEEHSPYQELPTWLQTPLEAAECFLRSEKEDRETCIMLVSWGRRRAKNFLHDEDNFSHRPFFGLCNPCAQLALSTRNTSQVGVEYFRTVARHLDLESGDAIIRYKTTRNREESFEYATAIPHLRQSTKRSHDGIAKPELVHSRWLCQVFKPELDERRYRIQSFGEHCQFVTTMDFFPGSSQMQNPDIAPTSLAANFVWEHPPNLFSNVLWTGSAVSDCPSLSGESALCSCFEPCPFDIGSQNQVCFKICAGDADSCALFILVKGPERSRISKGTARFASRVDTLKKQHLDPGEGAQFLRGGNITNREAVREYLRSFNRWPFGQYPFSAFDYQLPGEYTKSLEALHFARTVYKDLAGATIPLRVTSLRLSKAKYYKQITSSLTTDVTLPRISHDEISLHQQQFSCIALFESGVHDLGCDVLKSVIAIASANSIFVAAKLLSDPFDDVSRVTEVRRLVGNIGRPGLSLIVLPQQPARIRPLSYDYRIVPHIEYDLKREDNFGATSLHLSFTEWKRPINTSSLGAIDEDVSLVEYFISVHDRGRWVADLDAIMSTNPLKLEPFCNCGGFGDAETLISIDDWEELLDAPDGVGILRAHKNWAARLAATAIRAQQGHLTATLGLHPDSAFCAKCLANQFLHETGSRVGMIID